MLEKPVQYSLYKLSVQIFNTKEIELNIALKELTNQVLTTHRNRETVQTSSISRIIALLKRDYIKIFHGMEEISPRLNKEGRIF